MGARYVAYSQSGATTSTSAYSMNLIIPPQKALRRILWSILLFSLVRRYISCCICSSISQVYHALARNFTLCPRQESNLDSRVRSAKFYPLNYGSLSALYHKMKRGLDSKQF